jgi:hypothetical protein
MRIYILRFHSPRAKLEKAFPLPLSMAAGSICSEVVPVIWLKDFVLTRSLFLCAFFLSFKFRQFSAFPLSSLCLLSLFIVLPSPLPSTAPTVGGCGATGAADVSFPPSFCLIGSPEEESWIATFASEESGGGGSVTGPVFSPGIL